MINSIRIANQFIGMLPNLETPEHTEKYEGFYHLIGIKGEVEQTTLTYIIRDHDRIKFEQRKEQLTKFVHKINSEFGEGTAKLNLNDQYYNMREKIEPVMHIVDVAYEAMKQVGVTPVVKAIRGGTDGSQLTYMGLPCPNIGTGNYNAHGRYEFVVVEELEQMVEIVKNIVSITANKKW